jgi:dihydrofolate reductase
MSLTRIHNLSISLDGFATGEPQSADAPFGHAGERLHEWLFATRFWGAGGTGGVDNAFAEQHSRGIGAEIMGANKFGPPGWQDDRDWKGWWGANPPFHTPTFVLTHRPRPSSVMEGGTVFHFLDATPAAALETAREAAHGQDVRIGGGPPSCATTSPPGSSTTCISSKSPSCSAAASASGTAWKPSRTDTKSRQSPRPAASPTSPSRERSSRKRRSLH